jgi:hypothetical protein
MVAAFTVSQSAITPASFTVTDTSTSVTGSITKRRIFVQDAYGNYLTGDGVVDYDDWVLADASITLSILTQDSAVNINVQWLDVSNNVIEELDNNYPLSEFGKQFFFTLISDLGLSPGIYQDANYKGNLAVFWANIVAGDNAVTYGNSIAAAQNCYDRETEMRLKQSEYF